MPTALAITSDLMLTSMLDGAARVAEVELTIVPPRRLDQCDVAAPQLVLLDLGSLAGDAMEATVRRLRERFGDAAVLAFGPHVHREKLALAGQLGCATMSRGELHAKAADVLRQLHSTPAKPG